ncbi:MAG: hypothetical protein L0Z50_17350 [Verrucomicrobiales bacterium]|nr:hypothetical protein [Verrucomicrobiales bacterium]
MPARDQERLTARDVLVTGVAAGFGTMNHDPLILIGEREGWGDPRPFGISAVDERQHIYIIGKTGSGKTGHPLSATE